MIYFGAFSQSLVAARLQLSAATSARAAQATGRRSHAWTSEPQRLLAPTRPTRILFQDPPELDISTAPANAALPTKTTQHPEGHRLLLQRLGGQAGTTLQQLQRCITQRPSSAAGSCCRTREEDRSISRQNAVLDYLPCLSSRVQTQSRQSASCLRSDLTSLAGGVFQAGGHGDTLLRSRSL